MGSEEPGVVGAGHRVARPRLREQLSITAASAAGPYGYTISLGGSIALAVHDLRGPTLADTLLLMLGAVIAFVMLELIARGSLEPHRPATDRPPSVFGNAHVPSAGAAIVGAWAVVSFVPGPAAWALTGFAATALYFVVTAVQRILVAIAQERWSTR